MNLYLLDENFNLLSPVDFAEEVLWIRKYNALGECDLKIQCDQTIVNLLKDKSNGEAFYIVDLNPNSNLHYMCEIITRDISTTVNQGDYLNVVAYDVLNVLSRRLVLKTPFFEKGLTSIHPAAFLVQLLKDIQDDNTRKNNDVVIDNASFNLVRANNPDDLMDIVDIKNQDLLKSMLDICVAFNYGLKMMFDDILNKFVISLYKGQEVDVVFSSNFANIISTDYKYDKSTKKNWGIIVGATGKVKLGDTEDTTPTASVWLGKSEPSGRNRYETVIDASSVSRELTLEELNARFTPRKYEGEEVHPDGYAKTGDTVYYVDTNNRAIAEMDSNFEKGKLYEAFYLPSLIQYGQLALAKMTATKSFSGEVELANNYEYEVDYNLGDIVTAKNRYELGGKARITEIWISNESTTNGDTIEPKFEWQEEVL